MSKKPLVSDKDVPHNMGRSDVIRATDFNFLMVLGKGSFGKVSESFILVTVIYFFLFFFLRLIYYVFAATLE